MSDTQDKIEISEHKTRNYLLAGALAGLLLLVQGLCAAIWTNGINEMRETNHNLTEVMLSQRVQQTQMNYLQKDVEELKAAKKEAGNVHTTQDKRMDAIEQSIALHNQWIEAHNK